MNEEMLKKIKSLTPEQVEKLSDEEVTLMNQMVDEYLASKESGATDADISWDSMTVDQKTQALIDLHGSKLGETPQEQYGQAKNMVVSTPRQAKIMVNDPEWKPEWIPSWEMTKAGVGDLFSLGGRAIASLPEIGDAEEFQESVARTEPMKDTGFLGSAISGTLRSPETIPAIMGGAAVAPVAQGMGVLGRTGLSALGGGAPALGTKALSGEDVTAQDVAFEGVGALLGEGGERGLKMLGGKARDIGEGILEGYLKPSRKLKPEIEERNIIPKMLEQDIVPQTGGDAAKMLENVDKTLEGVDSQYRDFLTANPDRSVDVLTALDDVESVIDMEISQGMFSGDEGSAKKALQKYTDSALDNIVDQEGGIDLDKFFKWRKKIGSDAKFASTTASDTPKKMVAKRLYSALNDAMSKVAPELRALDAQRADLLSMQKLTEDASARVDKKLLSPGIYGYGALGGGTVAGTALSGDPVKGALIGGASLAAQKLLNSPLGARTFDYTGQGLELLGEGVLQRPVAQRLGVEALKQ